MTKIDWGKDRDRELSKADRAPAEPGRIANEQAKERHRAFLAEQKAAEKAYRQTAHEARLDRARQRVDAESG